MFYPERRREARFPLRYPGCLKASISGGLSEIAILTENVSVHGVLLSSDSFIATGTRAEIVLNLEPGAKRVQLACKGTVVRAERLEPKKFAVAVECERPLTLKSEKNRPSKQAIQ